jgi:hypothetical protein
MDETWAGRQKKIALPEAIVATNPKLGSVTVPQSRDDAQLALLIAISAFGDSTYPFILKLITFKKYFLLHRNSMKVMMPQFGRVQEHLSHRFIDWLETIFCRAFLSSGGNSTYDGPSILVADGHSTDVAPHMIALYGARNVILIRLVAHSSHLAEPPNLCLCGFFKFFIAKKDRVKE